MTWHAIGRRRRIRGSSPGSRLGAVGLALAILVIGSTTIAAAPAAISARPRDFGDGIFGITVSWKSGADNGNPVVWVCEGYNGNAPLTFDMGASGSQIANFIPPRTYLFTLSPDSTCATSVCNASVTVVHRG